MLNIISKSYTEGGVNGPQKVVENLIKGLDLIKYPYCINKALDSTSQLWIHDDKEAIVQASKMKLRALIGPNLYILPRHIPNDIDMSSFVYIYPSRWPMEFWRDFGFNKCHQDIWPAGIDTYEYSATKGVRDIVLIYFKQREEDELNYIVKELREKEIKYQLIKYGSYYENDYKNILARSKYIIWLGRQESQGIALQQALSSNIPIIVCEVKCLGQWVPPSKDRDLFTEEENGYKNVSAAPYFSEKCGIKIYDIKSIEGVVEYMENNYLKFAPREYILQNLGLEKQATDILNLFEKYYNIKVIDGRNEIIKNHKRWMNGKLYFVLYLKFKMIIKLALKKILT